MEEQIGKVIHFYDKISVAVVRLDGELRTGDMIHVKGKTSDFEVRVESMQVDHAMVSVGNKGDEVAIRVGRALREGDLVYKK